MKLTDRQIDLLQSLISKELASFDAQQTLFTGHVSMPGVENIRKELSDLSATIDTTSADQWIVLSGNMVIGFNAYGPFDTGVIADDFRKANGGTVMDLKKPN